MLMAEKRSFRLPGGCGYYTTSVCLEKSFWLALEKMATDVEMTLPQLISFISTNCRQKSSEAGQLRTLASCLRVICLKWPAACATPVGCHVSAITEIDLSANTVFSTVLKELQAA